MGDESGDKEWVFKEWLETDGGSSIRKMGAPLGMRLFTYWRGQQLSAVCDKEKPDERLQPGEAASLCQYDYEKWVGTHANGGTAGTQLGDSPWDCFTSFTHL